MKTKLMIALSVAVATAQTYRLPLQYSGGTVSHSDADGYRHVPKTYGRNPGSCLMTNGASGDAFWGTCPGASGGLDSAHVSALIGDSLAGNLHRWVDSTGHVDSARIAYTAVAATSAIYADSARAARHADTAMTAPAYLPLAGGTVAGRTYFTVPGEAVVMETDAKMSWRLYGGSDANSYVRAESIFGMGGIAFRGLHYDPSLGGYNDGYHPIKASRFVVDGGTSAQYQMGDGSLSSGPAFTDSARASHISDSAKRSGYADSSRAAHIADSVQHLNLYARTTAVHDTAGTLRAYTRASIHDSVGVLTPSRIGAEPTITAGTSAQYWRGDKTWATFPTTWAWGSITGTPTTLSGYGITDAYSSTTSRTANTFLAAPNGSAGAATFRAIVAADVPTLNQNTTGTAANITATSNSTLTTLSSLSLPVSQVTGISATAPITYSSGAIAHASTDGFHHIPATGTNHNGMVLASGATSGSEAWTATLMGQEYQVAHGAYSDPDVGAPRDAKFGGLGIATAALKISGATAGATSTWRSTGGGGSSAVLQAQATTGGAGIAWWTADGATDGKYWDALATGSTLSFRAVNDANSSATPFLRFTRSGMSFTGADINGNLSVSSLNSDGVVKAASEIVGTQVKTESYTISSSDPATTIGNSNGITITLPASDTEGKIRYIVAQTGALMISSTNTVQGYGMTSNTAQGYGMTLNTGTGTQWIYHSGAGWIRVGTP